MCVRERGGGSRHCIHFAGSSRRLYCLFVCLSIQPSRDTTHSHIASVLCEAARHLTSRPRVVRTAHLSLQLHPPSSTRAFSVLLLISLRLALRLFVSRAVCPNGTHYTTVITRCGAGPNLPPMLHKEKTLTGGLIPAAGCQSRRASPVNRRSPPHQPECRPSPT